LKRLFILVIRAVFDDNGVIAFTNFTVLLRLSFSLPLRLSFKSRRGGWDRDVLLHISLYNWQV
jgi:hypothetical protein